MKALKRIGAVVLAIMMIAFVGAAFAANNGDVYQDDSLTTVDANNKKIPMTKSIIMFNLNGSDVYEPNISYTYSVAPVTDELGTITDDGELNNNNPVTVQVNAGVSDGVTFSGTDGTITFSSDNTIVATDANGVEVEKSTNLTVDLGKFTHAGVYRYIITEADNSSAVTAAGMVRGADYNRQRYLDVYIKNGTTTPATLELYGAVIFKTNAQDTSNPVHNATNQITTTTYKTTGFEPGVTGETGSDIDYTSDREADHYTTYDFAVKKLITGGMADKTHEFPFYINITNTITDAAYTYINDPGTGTGTKETVASATITKGSNLASSTLALKDGEYVKFVGVPSSNSSALTIAVKEFNDSVDSYSASATVVNGTAPTVQMNGNNSATQMTPSTGYATLADFDLKTKDAAAQIITVTNNLAEISPTGIVTRYAPYGLILVAGVVLLVISKKRKKNTDEE